MSGPTRARGLRPRALAPSRLRALLCTGALLVVAAPRAYAQPADLVLTNGRIVTMDAARPEAQAIAMRGDRIVAVGSDGEIRAHVGAGTRVIDLGGKLAVPGFIEGHGHYTGLGTARLNLDLTTATSWDDIVALVRDAAAKAAPGEVIRGRGWHQEKWSSTPAGSVDGVPTHHTLSAVSPDNPVVLSHASGHATFVNAKAMELSGIGRTTADPAGGTVVKGPDGEPTTTPTGGVSRSA